jgi:methionine-rich copper-binding protein CopC
LFPTSLPTTRGLRKMSPRSSLALNGWLLLGVLGLLAGAAWAHAIIVDSTPKMHDVITGPVLEIKLRFNVRIDGGRSKLTLIQPNGTTRAVELPQQLSPDSLAATVPELSPGSYRLHWQVLASDGHITQGDIPFSVVIR